MKIRIKGNSIRYRLTQTEIAGFGKNGYLEERTEFLNGAVFYYCLEKRPGIDNLQATFLDNRITVFVPVSIAEEWTTTEAVGFNNTVPLGDEKELFLLIEKDFVCLDHTFEDQSDNYPNPNKACGPAE
ncbi:MAG: hypothetical protein FJY20_10635 [Bacteroidetes bacterium]|nr:hypothetical protein [Bacteroidota bacterium]